MPSGWGRCVVTIGVFDGVHRGHQQLIARAVAHGRELGLPTVLITFDPHPASVLRPGTHPARLTSLARRAELVAELGIDAFWVLPFTPDLARVAPDEFVHELLVDRLHAAMVVVGRNFTYGYRAAGDVTELERLGQRFGFAAEGVDLVADPSVALTGSPVTFSSTYVRACISAGDVRAAAEALGRPHRLEGVVVRGDQRGRELGYPTANVDCGEHAAIPADGVYACWFHHRGQKRAAATRWAPTRRSPGASAPSRRSCSTPTRTSTARGSPSTSSSGSAGWTASTRSTSSSSTMDRDVVRTREVLGV